MNKLLLVLKKLFKFGFKLLLLALYGVAQLLAVSSKAIAESLEGVLKSK